MGINYCRSCGLPASGTLSVEFHMPQSGELRHVDLPVCDSCADKGFDGESVDIRFDEAECRRAAK